MLIERGHEAWHVTDIGPGDMPDEELWRFALSNRAAIVTKDEDFSVMAISTSGGPAIVWVRVGNTRRAALLAWFEPLVDQIALLVDEGQRLIELR